MATNATPTARTAKERKRDERERKRTGGTPSLAAWAGHSASLPAAKKSKLDATAGGGASADKREKRERGGGGEGGKSSTPLVAMEVLKTGPQKPKKNLRRGQAWPHSRE